MKKDFVEKLFVSDMLACRNVITEISDFVGERVKNISDVEIKELRLIFSELLYNAVIHGNKLDAAKRVYIAVEIVNDVVFSTIRDDGTGFDYKRLLILPEDDYSERGRGLAIVNTLADAVSFNNKGNEIKFRKKVKLNE